MVTGIEPKSKSQVKREMLALQTLGEKLAGLSTGQINAIDMPLDLRDALLHAKTINKGEAGRRQLQYIGALMRETDVEPIRKALDTFNRGRLENAKQFEELERWRDELVDGKEGIMEEILSRFPGTECQTLRQLVLTARRERERGKPPKASRALFRFLKALPGSI
jgi:ribosome-associated protein